MNDTIVNLVFKLFGGTIKARINSYIVTGILFGIAQLMKLSPDLAHLVDPDKVAAFIITIMLIEINSFTNGKKNVILEDLSKTLTGDVVTIPVEKVEKT